MCAMSEGDTFTSSRCGVSVLSRMTSQPNSSKQLVRKLVALCSCGVMTLSAAIMVWAGRMG